MRVAVLFEYESLNGGERSWLTSVPFLQSQGVELIGIAPATGPLDAALQNAGVEQIAWPDGIQDESGRKRSQDEIRSQIMQVAALCAPDLLHANSLSMARTLGPLSSDLACPCIGHLRDILRLNPTVIRDLNGNDRLLAVSDATKKHHVEQGLDAERTHVLYNGVDLEAFRPGERVGVVHRELGIPADARLILTIGQIGLRKGLDVGLEVMRDLFTSDPTLHWLIVGERHSNKAEALEYERNLMGASNESPLNGRVHWLGCRSDVPQLMRESAVVLHLAKQEPLGRVLLEAAASGAAVVATDVGGTSEIFRSSSEDVAARLVPPGDASETAASVQAVLSDEGLVQHLGRLARGRAVESFSAGRASKTLLGHYRELVVGR